MSENESVPVDREEIPPDGYLRPRRFRLRLRCLRCGKEYFSRPFVAAPRVDPPCPRKACAVEREVERRLADEERMRAILEEGRPPAQGGRNPAIKAVDYTANLVMHEHKLTNLNDSMREGDSAAPKLPPEQQRAADSFFTGAEVARRVGGRRMQARVASLGAAVLGARAPVAGPRIGAIQAAAAAPGQSALVPRPAEEPFMVRMVPRKGGA